MFTGLVETVGTIQVREEFEQGVRFRIVARSTWNGRSGPETRWEDTSSRAMSTELER